MEIEELRRKLAGLWEKTTHNSKESISLLFDNYFETSLVEYKESEGKVLSALFGIPYKFGSGNRNLKALYIISLTSEEGFSKKGVLSELLDKFNKKVEDEFDFTFLVPHTELMADYFGSKGYLNSFFISEERYTPYHNFKNDYFLSLTESDDKIRELKKNLLEKIIVISEEENTHFSLNQIINYIEEIEKKGSSAINLSHTKKDLEYILNENNIRNLNYFISYDSDDGKITGIAFIEKDDLYRLKIVAIYVSDVCSYYAILEYIKHKFPDYSLSIIISDTKYQAHNLIQLNYVSPNPNGTDLDNTFSEIEIPFNYNKLLQPLGMIRILKFENILEFIAETRSDVDIKLHIRDYEPSRDLMYIIKNGKFYKEELGKYKNEKNLLTLSKQELSELLLRKNDSSNLIMEAFGIPRLNLQIRLLPF